MKGRFHASFLNWFARERLPSPKRLLDVGCDNGVLTCFYAKLFPDSEVVGIDLYESSIDRAKELAEKLSLNNVSFQVLNLNQAPDAFRGPPFDIVTATNVLTIDEENCSRTSLLADTQQLEIAPEHLNKLRCVQRLTTPDSGILLTTNSFDDRAVGLFTRMLSQAGFSLNWRRSAIIDWPDWNKKRETCPVLVAEHRKEPSDWSVDDAVAFCSYPQLAEKAQSLLFTDSAAEAVVSGCSPKRLVKGVRLTYPNGTILHMQLWTCGPLAFSFRYTQGCVSKSLELYSSICVPELLEQMDEAVKNASEGIQVEEYDCPTES
jgi:SAM-dependent methyltransferase